MEKVQGWPPPAGIPLGMAPLEALTPKAGTSALTSSIFRAGRQPLEAQTISL